MEKDMQDQTKSNSSCESQDENQQPDSPQAANSNERAGKPDNRPGKPDNRAGKPDNRPGKPDNR